MKKSCSGCKAHKGNWCGLGYKTKMITVNYYYAFLERMVPLEQCPKPKTYNDYFLQKKLKIKED